MTIGISTGTVLLYVAPVFVAILSTLVFKKKLYKIYLALGMNLVGVFLMDTLGNFSILNIALLGITSGLTSAFLHVSNTMMAKLSGDSDDALTRAFYMLVFSAISQGTFAQFWRPHNGE